MPILDVFYEGISQSGPFYYVFFELCQVLNAPRIDKLKLLLRKKTQSGHEDYRQKWQKRKRSKKNSSWKAFGDNDTSSNAAKHVFTSKI